MLVRLLLGEPIARGAILGLHAAQRKAVSEAGIQGGGVGPLNVVCAQAR